MKLLASSRLSKQLDTVSRLVPTIAAVAVKGVGALASFLVTFVIARTLGAAETGHYSLSLVTITTATYIALTGLDQVAIRTMAGDFREQRVDLARAAFDQISRRVLITGASLALIILAVSRWAPEMGLPTAYCLPISAAVLIFPLFRVVYAALRASGRMVLSQLFDGPSYTGLVAIVAVVAFMSRLQLPAICYLWAFVISMYLSLTVGYSIISKILPTHIESSSPRFGSLIADSWPIFLATIGLALTDWIILVQMGAYGAPSDVGSYRVAVQVISIFALMVSTVENLAGPGFAGDFRLKDVAAAKRRHRRASAVMAAVAGIPATIAFFFARDILLFFGPEFVVATMALRILLFGQLLNVLTGPVGVFLIMSGRERYSLVFSYFGLAVSLVVGFVLIPHYGAAGAAAAFLSSILIRNLGAFGVLLSVKQ